MGDFNYWGFDRRKSRSKMRYVVVMDGDLDLNNAIGFTSIKDLKQHLKEGYRKPMAVFRVEDMTDRFLD